jgi:NADPH-dependent curcumin reductase CurA
MGNPVKRKQNIMAQSTYTSVILAQRPKALIVPGETFSLKENPMISEKDLKDGQVLVETLYLSLDPAMRGWLNGTYFLHHNPAHVIMYLQYQIPAPTSHQYKSAP